MTSLNNPKTIWQLPNITNSSETLSRNDVTILAHNIPPSGSGMYYYVTFNDLAETLKATSSLYGTVKIHNDSLANSAIVYNKTQVDSLLSDLQGIITNLPVSQGGTGITFYNTNDLLYATSETTLGKLSSVPDSVLLTDSSGSISWQTQESFLNAARVNPATDIEFGTVLTNSYSSNPVVYLKEEIDGLMPGLTNPVGVDSGGTGITDLSGEVGKFLTVNSTEDGYNLSTLTSLDSSIIINQNTSTGNFDIRLPQHIETTSQVTFQKINIVGAGENYVATENCILDIQSNNTGVMFPRVPTATYTSWTNPPAGLMLFDSTLDKYVFYNGTAWGEIGEQEIPIIEELDDIPDVVITNPTAGEDFLGYDGTNWVNINIVGTIDSRVEELVPTITIEDLTGLFDDSGSAGYIVAKSETGKLKFLNPDDVSFSIPSGSVNHATKQSFYNYDSVILADNPICFIPYHSEATTNNLSTHTGARFRYGVGTHSVSFNYTDRVIKGYGNGISVNSNGTNVISLRRNEHPVFDIYQNRTIEFWMKYVVGSPNSQQFIADQGQFGDNTGWNSWCQFSISSNVAYFQTTGNKIGWYNGYRSDTGGEYRFNSNTSLINNSIYHIVYTLDTTTIKLYINGVLDNSGNHYQRSKINLAEQGNILIGRGNGNNSYPDVPISVFSGFAFYDYALSASQVLNHYNAGKL